jgi:hypothetical protein
MAMDPRRGEGDGGGDDRETATDVVPRAVNHGSEKKPK